MPLALQNRAILEREEEGWPGKRGTKERKKEKGQKGKRTREKLVRVYFALKDALRTAFLGLESLLWCPEASKRNLWWYLFSLIKAHARLGHVLNTPSDKNTL